jgi:hypothetical protein
MKGGAPLFSAAPYHAARWPHVSCGMLLPPCAARPREPCKGDGNDRPLILVSTCRHSAFYTRQCLAACSDFVCIVADWTVATNANRQDASTTSWR